MPRWIQLLGCALVAQAVEPFDIVQWEDLKLRPDANLVFADDRLIFHPRARISTGYDSNTSQSEQSQDSGFLGLAVGSTAVWLPIEDHRLSIEAVIEGDALDTPRRDGVAGFGSFAWEDQGEPFTQELRGNWLRNDSPSLTQTGRQIRRDEFLIRYDGTLIRDDASYGGGPLATRQRFLADGLDFSGETRDASTWGGHLHAGWQRTARSVVTIHASSGRLRYDERDGDYPDGTWNRCLVGWILPLGERTDLRLSGGGSSWRFQDSWAHDPARDDRTEVQLEGELGLRWDYEEDSFVDAHYSRTTERGVNSNLAAIEDAGVFGRLAILRTRGIDAELGMIRATASSAAPGQPIERRWGYRAGAGAELYYSAGWLWRVAVNYSDSRARIAESFTRTISMIQVTVAY